MTKILFFIIFLTFPLFTPAQSCTDADRDGADRYNTSACPNGTDFYDTLADSISGVIQEQIKRATNDLDFDGYPVQDYCKKHGNPPGITCETILQDIDPCFNPKDGKLTGDACKAAGGLIPCERYTDDPSTQGVNEAKSCSFCHFFYLLQKIINWILFRVAPLLGLLFLVFGGFLLAASRGNPGQVQFGKNIVIWSLSGYAVMLIGWTIINSVFVGIGLQKWTGLTGETGNFESKIGLTNQWKDDDKSWIDNQWKDFLIVVEHPEWVQPETRTVISNSLKIVTLNADLPAITGNIKDTSYKIGGWWQLKCPLN